MNLHHSDPFDLDDHRPRRATELDNFIAAGVREVEAQRGTRLTVPEPAWLDGEHAATDLSRAWEAASGEGQVVS